MIRSLRLSSLVALVSFGVAASFVASAGAAPKATPAPASSTSPSPAASATPEPLDHVISRLEAKLKADPNDKAAQQDLAGAYFQIQRPDLTLQLTKKLLAGGTKNAQVYYFDGIASASIGDTKNAVASLEQARNFEPTNAQVLGTLTTIYLRLNQPADAERVATKAIAFNKDDENAYINYGLVLGAEKKPDQARVQFEMAAKLNPKDAHPVVLEARSYVDENAIAFASQLFDRAIAIDPNSGEAIYGKAKLSAAQHNVKDAVANYEMLLKLSTDDSERASIVDEEAALYATEKMAAEADAAFRRAITTYPSVLGSHVAYGDYLASNKDQVGAEREWLAGAGANKDNPPALVRLGQLAITKKKIPEALDYFKKATELAPNDPQAQYTLAQLYMTQKQYEKARGAFRTSFGLQKTPEALTGLGAADFAVHNYPECADVFEALDKAPGFAKQNPQALLTLGQCEARANRTTKAKSTFRRFLPYTKPGSQAERDVRKLIADLDHQPKPAAPKATPAPKK